MEYELLFFTSVANEDRIGEIKKNIEEIITDQSGKISADFSDIGKRKFAHPIKRQTHGFYSFCWFTLEKNSNIPEISKRLSLNDKIMRHLIVRADEIGKPIAQQEDMRRESQKTESVAAEPRQEKAAEVKTKIGVEELDEKLNEILDENPN